MQKYEDTHTYIRSCEILQAGAQGSMERELFKLHVAGDLAAATGESFSSSMRTHICSSMRTHISGSSSLRTRI
jgi:hypothetical protein